MAFTVIPTDRLDTVTPADSYVPETPNLAELLRGYVRTSLQNLRVAFPSAVTQIRGDQTVDIQPLFQKRYAGQQPSNLPTVQNVRVLMPQGKAYRLSFPVAIGDTGLTVILDRNMDSWMGNTGDATRPVDPSDTRSHNLSDAVFIPGLVNNSHQTKDTGSDIVVGNGSMLVRISPDGTLRFENGTGELVSLINDIASSLSDTVDALAGVPQAAIKAATIKPKVAILKQMLSSFKG